MLNSLRSLSALVILCAGLLGTGSPLQAQDCGGSSPLRIFASTQDAAGQTTVWEVDVLSGTFQQVLQTGDPLTSGTYEPERDRLYFGSQGGGIYRFAPDGGGYEEVLPSGQGPLGAEAPVFDASGDLYFNTGFGMDGIWALSPPDPGGTAYPVLPQLGVDFSVGLGIGTGGASDGGLLVVDCFGDYAGIPPGVFLSSPPGSGASRLIDHPGTQYFWDMAVRGNGNILLSEPADGRLSEFDGDGNFLGAFASGIALPLHVEANPTDDEVICLAAGRLFVYDLDGTLLGSATLPPGESSSGLAIIPSGAGDGGSIPLDSLQPSPPLPRPGLPGFSPGGCEDCENPTRKLLSMFDGGVLSSTGESCIIETDVVLPCVGPDLVWRRTYRSRGQNEDSPCGSGWTHGYDERLLPCDDDLILLDGSGSQTLFEDDGTGALWTADEHPIEIHLQVDGSYSMHLADRGRMFYGANDGSPLSGKLLRTEDRYGNGITLVHDSLTNELIQLDHDDGHSLILTRNASGQITSVAIPGVGSYLYGYASAGAGGGADLVSVTTPAVTGTPNGNDFPTGKTTTYAYSSGFADEDLNHNLLSITTALGNTPCRFQYAPTTDRTHPDFDRVVRKVLGDSGDNIDFVYVGQTPGAGNGYAVQKTIVNDCVGNVTELLFDTDRRLVMRREFTGRADPDLPTMDTANRPSGKLRSSDPDFFETSWTWNKDARITSVLRPEGDSTQSVYEGDFSSLDFPLWRGNLRETHFLPGPRGADQPKISHFFEYLSGGGGCCGSNFVTRETDGRGNDTVHTYDASGNRIQTVRRDTNIVETWAYDTKGRMTQHTFPSHTGPGPDGSLRTDSFSYYGPADGDQNGRLKSVTQDTGGALQTSTFAYDNRGDVVLYIDYFLDTTTKLTRNQLGQVVRETLIFNDTGLSCHVDSFFDADDNLVRIEEENRGPDGALDNLIPSWVSRFEFGGRGEMTRSERQVSVDNAGPVFVAREFAYDANLDLVLERKGEAVKGVDPFNAVATGWDERRKPFQTVRAPGHPSATSTSQVDYDLNGNPVAVHEGIEDGARTSVFTYDGFNRLVRMDDPMGNRELASYDANGNRVQSLVLGELIDVPGSAVNLRLAQDDITYDVMDRVVRIDQAHFDPATQTPLGDGARTQTFVWSAASQLLAESNDNGNTSTREYDGLHRLVRKTDAAGNRVEIAYDATSNVVTLTETERSDLGAQDEVFVTTHTYDGLGRLVSTSNTQGSTWSRAYDSRSNLVRSQDAKGRVVRYDFDGLKRPLATRRELGRNKQLVTSQAWDDSSRLISRTDDNGNKTRYQYDSLDRLIREKFADGTSRAPAYDAHDDPVSGTDANGTSFTGVFDLLSRPIGHSFTPASGVSPATSFEQRTWDGLSRLTGALDDDSTVVFRHDSLGNVTSETLNGHTITSTHDGVGNRTGLVYPGGRSLQFGHDPLERLKQVTDATGPGAPALMGAYDYVGPGRVTRRTLGNGTRMELTYDGIKGISNPSGDFGERQIVRVQHLRPDGTTLMQDEITWDRVGNKTSEVMTAPGLRPLGHRYEYDPVGRMVHSQRSRSSGPPALGGRRGKRAGQNRSYHLDGVGNRTQVGSSPAGALPGDGKYVTDSVNAYIKTPFDTRVHDANGNLTAIDPGTPTRRLITYDVRDRMVEYLVVATGELTRYAYDALGRRTIKVRDATGNPKATSYLYDGWRVIEERDGADQVQATYAYGNYIDERLSMERGGNEYWYHPDDLHSVRALSDSGGVVVERYEYDDFGQVTIRDGSGKRITGSALANPYLFTGRRLDLETGWYEYRTRYMDPSVGKFTTRDPIGIWGDSANLGNSLILLGCRPMSLLDPFGLETPGPTHRRFGKKKLDREFSNLGHDDWKKRSTAYKFLKANWDHEIADRARAYLDEDCEDKDPEVEWRIHRLVKASEQKLSPMCCPCDEYDCTESFREKWWRARYRTDGKMAVNTLVGLISRLTGPSKSSRIEELEKLSDAEEPKPTDPKFAGPQFFEEQHDERMVEDPKYRTWWNESYYARRALEELGVIEKIMFSDE